MTADAVGGVWQYAVDLTGELTARGCEVLLAVLGPAPSGEQQQQMAQLSGAHVVGAPFALEWMEKPWEDVARSKEWLLGLEQEFRPDIIHLNGYSLADAPWSAPTLLMAHSCVVSWWQAVHGAAPPSEWDEYKRRVWAGLHAASSVVAPSRCMADSIASNYGIARESITVIANFSSAELPQRQLKEEFFLAAGRVWDKAKNLALLEAIAPEVAWPVAIAGNESASGGLQESKSRHLGRLSHSALGKHLARAAVFVHPALYEPFGLAVLEAARAQCCLVLADIPSLRELWDGAAIFVNPCDLTAWVRDLNEVAQNKHAREALGARAFRHAERYAASASVAAYLDLYERMLNSGHQKAGTAA